APGAAGLYRSRHRGHPARTHAAREDRRLVSGAVRFRLHGCRGPRARPVSVGHLTPIGLISVKVVLDGPGSLRAAPRQLKEAIRSMCSPRISLLLTAATLLLSPASNLGAGDATPAPGTYRVVDGKVDGGTYAGRFVSHLSCHMCHGKDASGTDVAPDLRQSLKSMTQAEFATVVLARYRILISPADAR